MVGTRVLLIVAALVVASPVRGALIAGWDFSPPTQPIDNGYAPTTLAAEMTSTQGLTRGSGLSTVSLARAFSSGQWVVSSQDDAISGNKFITFSLTPTPGNAVSYTTLDYKVRRSSTGANAFIWQYQIGAGTFTNIETATSYIGTEGDGFFFADDLSAIVALQNVTDTITFRFVGWGGAQDAGTLAFGRLTTAGAGGLPGLESNTLAISGTVTAIPEPATWACLLCAACIGCLLRRSR